MRLPAALGVIWRHTDIDAASGEMGRASVPFFAALAAFMAYRHAVRKPEEPLSEYTWGRVSRLLDPFLVWTLIYGAVRSVASQYTDVVTPLNLTIDVPLRGWAYHLWFLPFVFFVAVGAYACGRLVTQRPGYAAPLLVTAILLAIANMIAAERIIDFTTLSYVPGRWIEALPSAFLGLAYAVTWFHVPSLRLRPSLWWAVPTAVVMAVMVARAGELNVALKTAAGCGLLLFALTAYAPGFLTRIRIPSELSYGVYLCHVLFVEGVQDFIRIVWGLDESEVDFPVFVAASLLSVAFVLVAMRFRLRPLYGG